MRSVSSKDNSHLAVALTFLSALFPLLREVKDGLLIWKVLAIKYL